MMIFRQRMATWSLWKKGLPNLNWRAEFDWTCSTPSFTYIHGGTSWHWLNWNCCIPRIKKHLSRLANAAIQNEMKTKFWMNKRGPGIMIVVQDKFFSTSKPLFFLVKKSKTFFCNLNPYTWCKKNYLLLSTWNIAQSVLYNFLRFFFGKDSHVEKKEAQDNLKTIYDGASS